jgi:hypothetical protein
MLKAREVVEVVDTQESYRIQSVTALPSMTLLVAAQFPSIFLLRCFTTAAGSSDGRPAYSADPADRSSNKT